MKFKIKKGLTNKRRRKEKVRYCSQTREREQSLKVNWKEKEKRIKNLNKNEGENIGENFTAFWVFSYD